MPKFSWLAALCLLVALPAQAGIDVRVRGLGSDERDNVLTQLAILQYAKAVDASKPPDRQRYDAEEVQRRFEEGESDIRKALQPFGWYNPVIHSTLTGALPNWTATYNVIAGPETDVAAVKIEIDGDGRDDPSIRQAIAQIPLKVGERLKHDNYEAAKQQIARAAATSGYLDATYATHELQIDVDHNSAVAVLTLDTGPRYFFGPITLDQNILKDKFLRRYLKVQPGQPFDSSKLLATQFALSDLGYFDQVDLDPRKAEAGPDRHIPVVIHLTPRKPHVYRASAGYGTDTGARVGVGTDCRHVNEEGHTLSLDARISQRITTATADYKIPLGRVPGESLSLRAQALTENVEDFQEHLYSIGASRNYLATPWQHSFYLTYARDDFAFNGGTGTSSRLLTPGITFNHAHLDDPIFPHRGWSLFLDLHAADEALLSNASLLQAHLTLNGVVSPFAHVRLLGRVEEGASVVQDFANLPPSQRFFAGGDQSVRGYSYESLGPKSPSGEVLGGKYLTTFSTEAEYDFGAHYGIAVFNDAGGADNTFKVKLYDGVGIGFRYRAPFGSVAIDLAHPLESGYAPVKLHLGVRVGL